MNNQSRPAGKGFNVEVVAEHNAKPIERKLKMIEFLKKQLSDAGHPVNYLVEPTSNSEASRVIASLVNLCKKYNVDFRSVLRE